MKNMKVEKKYASKRNNTCKIIICFQRKNIFIDYIIIDVQQCCRSNTTIKIKIVSRIFCVKIKQINDNKYMSKIIVNICQHSGCLIETFFEIVRQKCNNLSFKNHTNTVYVPTY